MRRIAPQFLTKISAKWILYWVSICGFEVLGGSDEQKYFWEGSDEVHFGVGRKYNPQKSSGSRKEHVACFLPSAELKKVVKNAPKILAIHSLERKAIIFNPCFLSASRNYSINATYLWTLWKSHYVAKLLGDLQSFHRAITGLQCSYWY